jgi:hypothetical protein
MSLEKEILSLNAISRSVLRECATPNIEEKVLRRYLAVVNSQLGHVEKMGVYPLSPETQGAYLAAITLAETARSNLQYRLFKAEC